MANQGNKLTDRIAEAARTDLVYARELERIPALSIHRSRGSGGEGSLNLQRLFHLLFGAKAAAGDGEPLCYSGAWKRLSVTKNQKMLPGDIYRFFTGKAYEGEPFSAPFSESYLSQLKKGNKELSEEAHYGDIFLLSGFLARRAAQNAMALGCVGQLVKGVETILSEEIDKTGLTGLLEDAAAFDAAHPDEERLYALLYDFLVIACMRRNTVGSGSGKAYNGYDAFLTSVFEHGDAAVFKEQYIPVFLTENRFNAESEPVPLEENALPTLAAALAAKNRVIVFGGGGTGKTTVLRALAAYYQDVSDPCAKLDALQWYSDGTAPALASRYSEITWIRGRDIGDSFHNDFRSYVTDDTVIYREKASEEDAAQRKKKLIVVDGLDDIPLQCDNNSVPPREVFLNSLKALLCADSGVDTVITSGEQGLKELNHHLLGFVSETGAHVYRITPPDRELIRAACRKRQISEELQEKILPLIDNNQAIREITSTHHMLSHFLDVTKRDGGMIPIRSQHHLLRDIVDINVIHTADVSSQNVPVNEYDIKSVLGLLALTISEHCIRSNRFFSGIPVFAGGAGDGYSIEELLADRRSMALDMFLTENSCLRPLCDAATAKQRAESLVAQFRTNQSPFVRIISDVRKKNKTLVFSSEIWLYYFSSYAVSNGIGIGKGADGHRPVDPLRLRRTSRSGMRYRVFAFYDDTIEYVNARIFELCVKNRYQNESVLRAWMEIIAEAAIFGRKHAHKYLRELAEYAADPSPRNRTAREFATRTTLKILRNSPFLTTNDWKKSSETALSYYLYHDQLEDFDAILRFSNRRETFCKYLFEIFFRDVRNQCPIPRFIFSTGYIFLRWIPIEAAQSGAGWEALAETALRNIDSRRDELNPLDKLVDRANELYLKAANHQLTEDEMPFYLLCVMAICSHYWLGSKQTLFTEIRSHSELSCELTVNNEINRCLIRLMQAGDWRIRNLAGFALTHIISYAIDNCNGSAFQILQADATPDARYARLLEIINADYETRKQAERAEACDKTPFCGALRLMTVVPIAADDYGKVGGLFPTDEPKAYYRRLWETYLRNVRDNRRDGGHSQRYLMLFFRICFLLGVWDDGIAASGADNPMEILFELKNKAAGSNIGLRYDREEMLFKEIRAIADCLTQSKE